MPRKKKSIAEARTNLPQLIRDAEAGIATDLTRHGEPVAVLLGRNDYERLTARRLTFWEAYEEFLQRHDLAALDLDVDEIFAGVRDRSPGRDVKL